MDHVSRIGMEVDIFSVGGYHRYRIIEITDKKIKLVSTTNPSKFITLDRIEFESGEFSHS